jgi:hypothetical protein
MFRIKHYPPEHHYGMGNNLCERCPNRAQAFTWEFGDDLDRSRWFASARPNEAHLKIAASLDKALALAG